MTKETIMSDRFHLTNNSASSVRVRNNDDGTKTEKIYSDRDTAKVAQRNSHGGRNTYMPTPSYERTVDIDDKSQS